MEIKYRKLSELKPSPKNPRKVEPGAVEELAKSIQKNPHFFEARPILLSDRTGELVIIAGERRSEAAAFLGMDKVPTILMSGLTEAQEDEIMIRDNTHAGVWDEKKLKKWTKETLQSWAVYNEWGRTAKEEKYTRKIESPIYEPKGEKPQISELYERTKANKLIEEIKKARIPAEIQDFLIAAAQRHIVFHFDKIAEFYAQTTPKIQRLFENSALVIIDFEDAIGGGYVKMCESLIEQYKIQNDD